MPYSAAFLPACDSNDASCVRPPVLFSSVAAPNNTGLEEGVLFDAAMVEDVVLGAAPATVVVDGDVVVVFTAVVEVVGWAEVDVVVAFTVVDVVARAKRLRAAAAAGSDVLTLATPTA